MPDPKPERGVMGMSEATLFDTEIKRAAVISDCMRYRYSLIRWWGAGPYVLWVMLNPSTADGMTDDPTIRKCIGFTKRWGYNGFIVVNLFGWRATKPVELQRVIDPIGPENDGYIQSHAAGSPLIVAAWGANGFAGTRAKAVKAMIPTMKCLGVTQGGHPKHTCYLSYELPLVDFSGPQ